MATFETLPQFELAWRQLTHVEQARYRKVVIEAFEPDLRTPGRPFRAALRVREIGDHPGVFEMTWGGDGRATFSYGAPREQGQPHVVWRQIGTLANWSH